MYSGLFICVNTPVVFAGNNTGDITMKRSTDTVTPVDPANPDVEIISPKPGTAGPLSIDYVPDFKFGEHKRDNTSTQTYWANHEEVMTTSGETVKRPSFIQITDNRNSGKGWKLFVKQESPLNSPNFSLTGSYFVLGEPEYQSLTGLGEISSDTQNAVTLLSDNQSVLVAEAKSGSGMGTWSLNFINNKQADKSNVSLVIPKEIEKKDGVFTTSLTWSLVDSI